MFFLTKALAVAALFSIAILSVVSLSVESWGNTGVSSFIPEISDKLFTEDSSAEISKSLEESSILQKETSAEQSKNDLVSTIPNPPEIYNYNNELYLTGISGEQKIAYLTFDDGPSIVTERILDILAEENIKATFFVLGRYAERNPQIVKRAFDEGHTICNHTYSHETNESNAGYIFKNVETFMNEVNRTEDIIAGIIGEENCNKIFRFPGGAFSGRRAEFKSALEENGYVFINWNCTNSDADAKFKGSDPEILLEKFIETAEFRAGRDYVSLMHDSGGQATSAESLPLIINYLREQGYIFRTVDGKE